MIGKIRFPQMEEGYLRSRVVGMAPAEDAEWMEGVVAEALRAKAAQEDGNGSGFDFKILGPKALDHRVGPGLEWGKFANGGERRLKGHLLNVTAIVECQGRVCSGSMDGSIRVWSLMPVAAETLERRLVPEEGGDGAVLSLSVWEGRLVSGHGSGKLRVWNVVTGACDQVLAGHTWHVFALAVCGSRLASGSSDGSVRVWAMGADSDAPWTCERTLLGHTDWVRSLAGWQGKALSGADDCSIRVWDVATGAHDATLAGHGRAVCALAVHGDRLFSASEDGTIRAWALGTWAALRTVEACGGGSSRRHVRCLAVSASQLVSGSTGGLDGLQGDVQVWGLERLDLRHTLPQPAGASVGALLAVEGGVLAGVWSDVVVWGRGA